MTHETRTEIIVFSGVAAFALYLFFAHKTGSVTGGLEMLPFGNNQESAAVPGGVNLPSIAPVAGDMFSYTPMSPPAHDSAPAAINTTAHAGGCSCGCDTPTGGGTTMFGSAADWLGSSVTQGQVSAIMDALALHTDQAPPAAPAPAQSVYSAPSNAGVRPGVAAATAAQVSAAFPGQFIRGWN
jgi:hypothetical protein